MKVNPETDSANSSVNGSRQFHAMGMLILLCVIWGMTFPATRTGLMTTDPAHFLALRFGLAVIIVTPFMLIRSRRRSGNANDGRSTNRGTFLLGCWVGLFLLIGYLFQNYGLSHTTASRSGFFTGLLVLIVPLLALLFRTSRMRTASWLGIPIAVGGIYLMADPEIGGMNIGDWLTIACAFAFALQMIVLETVARKGGDVWMLTYAQMVVVGAGASIWSLVEGNALVIESRGWLALGYTAMFGSIIATWLQTRFQPEVPAGNAAIVFTLEPVFAAIVAWLLLSEGWTMRGLMGAALILVAMGVSRIGGLKAQRMKNI